MALNPVSIDSDAVEAERAKLSAMTAFAPSQTTTTRRLETPPEDTKRTLVSVDVSIHEKYRCALTDKIIDAALSTQSHTARLLIEHDTKSTDKGAIISFHAASINSAIPDDAEYIRTCNDPQNAVSRVHIYRRTAGDEPGDRSDSPKVGTITRRPAIQ